MSPRTRILSLNLGSQSIELAEFYATPDGGLILHGYYTRELLADASEGMQHVRVAAELREMLGERQIKSGNVNYAIAENLVFTRFVKLPSIEEEKIERIVAFEAQQNVPFPIEEVVWDYQIVSDVAEEQIEVVLVAIKADLLEEINATVEATGLRTAIVDVATMALGNAFRYNYADLSGCSLLVDIGSRTTNLLFIEPAKIFCRSVPIGGSSITSAIAKEFNEPFATAELRKKCDGSAKLAGPAAKPEAVRVSEIVRGTMMRLHAELMRSISHYRAQQKGGAPVRVFLSGGCAGTSWLREFFQEKLQLPTELFNPLRKVAVTDSSLLTEITDLAHLLGEPVGLALRTASPCSMRLNLRPASVVRRQQLEKRRPFLIASAACFVFGLLALGAYYTRATQVARHMTEQVRQNVDVMRGAELQIDKLRKRVAACDSVAGPLMAAINDRSFWVEILEELNARLPKRDIWLTELIATSGGKPVETDERRRNEISSGPVSIQRQATATKSGVTIDGILGHGLYLFNPKQQEVVVDYFRNLTASSLFKVEPNRQSDVIEPTVPNNVEWAFPYTLKIRLGRPMKLP